MPSFEKPPEGPERLSNITFEKKVYPSGDIEFFYSHPLSKRMVLEKGSEIEPEPGVPYEVEVVEDTNPQDPAKGKLIVRIWEGDAPVEKKEKRAVPLPVEVDQRNSRVYVLETELDLNEKGGELVPNPERFKYFALDKRTLETIDKVATAVELREPCLLEGETSTSKTSSIEYLASQTNNEVSRMNLNGQTDTSELIGKFIPNDGQLQIEFQEALYKPELLSEQSMEILRRANEEGRGLTLVESQKIAQAEGIKVPDWRWQDGIVPDAMKNGRWVILDEVNLAEPQILERLNPVLEKNPSIVLSENGGVKIGEGGKHETHPAFRLFGTMNPAEYQGRKPMSPAYKDRWTSYKFVPNPSQEEYLAMMRLMTFGEQPEVEVRGKKYKGENVEPMFENLKQVPNMAGFLQKLAKFETVLEDLARRQEIGKGRKEKYIFTRRGLIELLSYMDSKTIIDRKTDKKMTVINNPQEVAQRAIQYYFLDKLSNPDDIKKVNDHLGLMGISRDKWTHKFQGGGFSMGSMTG